MRGVSRGEATITVTATDHCGASGSGEFDVTVPNTRPVVGSIPDRTVSRGLTRSVAVTTEDRRGPRDEFGDRRDGDGD